MFEGPIADALFGGSIERAFGRGVRVAFRLAVAATALHLLGGPLFVADAAADLAGKAARASVVQMAHIMSDGLGPAGTLSTGPPMDRTAGGQKAKPDTASPIVLAYAVSPRGRAH